MRISGRGHSLLELQVTLTLVLVLASISHAGFNRYLLQRRRHDAQSHLMSLQLAQESYRLSHGYYCDDLARLGKVQDENYDYSQQLNGDDYRLDARVRLDSPQRQDDACLLMTLTAEPQRQPADCW